MGATLVTSCSDDKNDPDVQGPKLEETTFTESFGLDLKVGDAPMYGKVVTFSPAADMKTAELTMQSTFDFASIPDFPQGLVNDTKVQCPGVLPGTPVEVLKVNLVPDNTDDKYYTFSGEADATYCTYKYSGKVSERNLKLSTPHGFLRQDPMISIRRLFMLTASISYGLLLATMLRRST